MRRDWAASSSSKQTGVAEFNRRCRESVWRYRGDWEKLSERIALLARLQRSLRHVPQQLRRERVVGVAHAARQGRC